jgi:hypothetical protein
MPACKRKEANKRYFRFFNGVEYYHVASFIYKNQAAHYVDVVCQKGGKARVVKGTATAGNHPMENCYLVFVRDDVYPRGG